MSRHHPNRSGPALPPRLPALLVRLSVDESDRAEVLGDLQEAFQSRAHRLGRARATFWYWSQAGHYLVRGAGSLAFAPVRGLLSAELRNELWRGKRVFGAAPFFSAVVVTVMALGIGANTAMFDTIRKALIQPLPFAEPQRLVAGRTTFGGEPNPWSSGPDYLEFRAQVDAFQELAAVMPFGAEYTLTGAGEPERVKGVPVSTNYFETLGVPPTIGRSFSDRDGTIGAPDVVVLDPGYWMRRFAGDPSVVGTPVVLDGRPYDIVGVAGAGSALFDDADFWRPMRPDRDGADDPRFHNWMLVGRLRSGVDATQAQAQADVTSAQLSGAYPESHQNKALLITPLHWMLVEGYRGKLAMLLGAVGLIFLIAVANVAGMFLARTPSRRTELSVRAALGASKGSLVSQMLSEALWLSALASLAGVILALGLEQTIGDLLVLKIPGMVGPSLSLPVLGTAVGLGILTGLAAGAYPALAATGGNLALQLRAGRGNDRGGARFRTVLISGQVAVSVVLLIGSGLLLSSLREASSVETGFETENLLTAEIEFPGGQYEGLPEILQFLAVLETDLQSLPTVQGVAMANNLPLRDPGNTYPVWARADDPPETSFAYRSVSPGYFESLAIPLLAGRGFEPTDVRGAPEVALLSEGAARLLFPDGSAIGETVVQGFFGEERRKEVVGIVGDVRESHLERAPRSTLYTPMAQRASRLVRVGIRYEGDPANLVSALRGAVRRQDPDLAIADLKTMEDVARDLVAGRRTVVTALTLYALLPLIMAAVGLYALLAYHVQMRKREIGIRLALGARPGELGIKVLIQGGKLAAIGVGVGLAAAYLLTRTVSAFLFGVSPHDPKTFLAVGVAVMGLSLVAIVLPARRAVGTDPLVSFRTEN